MKKIIAFLSLIIIFGCIRCVIFEDNENSVNIIEKYFDSDDTPPSDGIRPEYKNTKLKIKYKNFYIAIVEDTRDTYHIFYLSKISKGGYVKGGYILNDDIKYFKVPGESKESQYFGVIVGKGTVEYEADVRFFQYKSITLKIDGENRHYIVWSMQLFENQKFDENNIKYNLISD
ncbi:hypothetical protein M2475_001973 [Breznakia sp. PF5-3]|uniref:hypothetical protein n=1 Tax=unclassified Breznakia TaxID=2623764 RepID=UPI00240682E1|nr:MULTISPECIES: hypothetical protein [unclassified Breznakia]MDF9825526.1 hypothetical protein [Breznakia sp. PM6-1]MDF9836393.1 hypothetical protein [Breznakia sp. PF5-3]MDF9838950.1 hypothetical protein [Breznakia sp. PFB2-8]MDF9860545.1 hypothetical protein [Breznakia sp. PH5-24]